MENIIYEIVDGTVLLTVNRPRAMNALNSDTINELKSFIVRISADDNLYCCIIRGAGDKAFIAGADISQMYDMGKDEFSAYCTNANELFQLMQESSVIFIAAINGYALGGGNELAMACDLRIASKTAVFGQPEIHLGIIPGFGGTQRLPALIGTTNAMNLMLSGARIDADKALQLGLVSEVVDPEMLIESAMEMARSICKKSHSAVISIKKAVYEGFFKSIYPGIKAEASLISDCFTTKERVVLMEQMLGR